MKYNYSRHYSTPNSPQQSADYLNKTTMKQTNSCSIVAGWQPLDRKHVISLHFYTIALFPFVLFCTLLRSLLHYEGESTKTNCTGYVVNLTFKGQLYTVR